MTYYLIPFCPTILSGDFVRPAHYTMIDREREAASDTLYYQHPKKSPQPVKEGGDPVLTPTRTLTRAKNGSSNHITI